MPNRACTSLSIGQVKRPHSLRLFAWAACSTTTIARGRCSRLKVANRHNRSSMGGRPRRAAAHPLKYLRATRRAPRVAASLQSPANRARQCSSTSLVLKASHSSIRRARATEAAQCYKLKCKIAIFSLFRAGRRENCKCRANTATRGSSCEFK